MKQASKHVLLEKSFVKIKIEFLWMVWNKFYW